MIFFEDIMQSEMALIPTIVINDAVSRKPSFGWGSTADLRKFLAVYKEAHSPLIWSVPQDAEEIEDQGRFTRKLVLNLCAVESDQDMLNGVRLQPDKSFKKILAPLWESIKYRFELSSISIEDTSPVKIGLIPNYKVPKKGSSENQRNVPYIWDVMRISCQVTYSESYSPCKS